jgi:RimJ/RimL family protein N-acetyltransferase
MQAQNQSLRPPETIKTARLHLRRPLSDDAQVIFEEYAQDPEVTRYLTWRPSERLADTQAFLNGCIARWDTAEEFSWILTLPPGNCPMGLIACRPHSWRIELGYALAKRFWNHGFMTEAVRNVSDCALTSKKIYRVWAYCDVSNTPSARVLEKAGMQREGILRRWTIHPNISSEPRDCFAYSRTR